MCGRVVPLAVRGFTCSRIMQAGPSRSAWNARGDRNHLDLSTRLALETDVDSAWRLRSVTPRVGMRWERTDGAWVEIVAGVDGAMWVHGSDDQRTQCMSFQDALEVAHSRQVQLDGLIPPTPQPGIKN